VYQFDTFAEILNVTF